MFLIEHKTLCSHKAKQSGRERLMEARIQRCDMGGRMRKIHAAYRKGSAIPSGCHYRLDQKRTFFSTTRRMINGDKLVSSHPSVSSHCPPG